MRESLSEHDQQKVRDMDVQSLAKFLFCWLKKNQFLNHPHRYDFSPTFLGIREVFFPNAGVTQYRHYHVRLLEAVALLERRGLVTRDFSYPPTPTLNSKPKPLDQGYPDKFAIHITSLGMETEYDDSPLIVDAPRESANALEKKIEKLNLDKVVKQYYLESLRAYQAELYIASVLCLGVASERAIDWFAESVKGFCSASLQKTLENKINQNISGLTKYLSDTIIPTIFDKNEKTKKDLRKQLDWHAQLYRENRNDAGHPQGGRPRLVSGRSVDSVEAVSAIYNCVTRSDRSVR